MNDNRSDIAAFNLLSDILKMYQNVRKECLARLGEAELMLKQGSEHLHEKNYQEATVLYTRSLIWNPRDSRVYSNRALCYMRLEKMPRALEDADKCIELDP
ncbi:hypothetical protein M0R45_014891 [Rubus argutus]|uniref:Uncharacterized protein n=1 Tax=Rubus argutus TaxID=59490 RepID=A0AAW1XN17_RUBAR